MMDKIEELEKRIEKLEKQLKAEKNRNNLQALSNAVIVSPDKKYRVELEKMYSVEHLSEKFKQLDFKRAIEGAKTKNDRSEKLEYWYRFKNKLRAVLGDLYGTQFWFDLCHFTEKAIQHYEHEVIKRLLEEGEYFKGKGNQSTYDPVKTARWFDELSENEKFRKNGKPYKKKIYQEIRKRHNNGDNMPYPTDKTIRTHLKEAGRIGK